MAGALVAFRRKGSRLCIRQGSILFSGEARPPTSSQPGVSSAARLSTRLFVHFKSGRQRMAFVALLGKGPGKRGHLPNFKSPQWEQGTYPGRRQSGDAQAGIALPRWGANFLPWLWEETWRSGESTEHGAQNRQHARQVVSTSQCTGRRPNARRLEPLHVSLPQRRSYPVTSQRHRCVPIIIRAILGPQKSPQTQLKLGRPATHGLTPMRGARIRLGFVTPPSGG